MSNLLELPFTKSFDDLHCMAGRLGWRSWTELDGLLLEVEPVQ